jgi:hypothetical protein
MRVRGAYTLCGLISAPILCAAIATAVAAPTKTEAACRDSLMRAAGEGAISDMGFHGGTMVVIVNEAIWRRITYSVKVALVDTINCAIAGDGKVLMEIDFLSNMTNRRLGVYSWGKLKVEQ